MKRLPQRRTWKNWWKKEFISLDRNGIGFASLQALYFLPWDAIEKIVYVNDNQFVVIDKIPELDILKNVKGKPKLIFMSDNVGMSDLKQIGLKKASKNYIVADLSEELIHALQAFKLKV